ncbi:MAG: chlorophyll synthesis pathway protein BchC [Pseudomonadota bacterium]
METDSALAPQPVRTRQTRTDSSAALQARGVVFTGDRHTALRDLKLKAPAPGDVVVDIAWSGVSTGTERMLWSGDMPPFPGMGYPLVPGYESVGRIVESNDQPDLLGQMAFVPGASCYENASGLFGASASRLVVASDRIALLGDDAGPEHTLLALAATAHHAIARGKAPDLVVGNGVLGRLVARLTQAITGEAPTVWETDPERRKGTNAIDPSCDMRADYGAPCDVSGSTDALDTIIAHAGRGAEITLAGFYKDRPSFAFPPAFMKEVSLHVAAEWRLENLRTVVSMVRSGALRLDGLITHTTGPDDIANAYATAFEDPSCLKMLIDWEPRHDHAH